MAEFILCPARREYVINYLIKHKNRILPVKYKQGRIQMAFGMMETLYLMNDSFRDMTNKLKN